MIPILCGNDAAHFYLSTSVYVSWQLQYMRDLRNIFPTYNHVLGKLENKYHRKHSTIINFLIQNIFSVASFTRMHLFIIILDIFFLVFIFIFGI